MVRFWSVVGLAAILISHGSLGLAANGGPDAIDYQGVLRDAMGNPLNGNFDMVFRLVDLQHGVVAFDERLAANGNPVEVVGGLFRVAIGRADENDVGGTMDGPGPGTYGSLRQIFRDYAVIHLEIVVNGEVLTPSIPVNSSAYAFNSTYVNGLHSSQFLRSDEPDLAESPIGFTALPSGAGVTDAPLFVNPATAGTGDTLLGVAVAGEEQLRMDGAGTLHGKFLRFEGDCPDQIDVGSDKVGIIGRSSDFGGRFSSCEGSVAVLGGGHFGISASAPVNGGIFTAFDVGVFSVGGTGANIREWPIDAPPSEAWIGRGGVGIEAVGDSRGGIFRDNNGSGFAELAVGQIGISAFGDQMGGLFTDSNSSARARVAFSDRGVDAYGDEFGVWARGGGGGYFETTANSNRVYLATANYGVSGFGILAGVRAEDTDAGTRSWLAHGTATVSGTGTKDFIQNHPYDSTRVIAYSAPEGDEVATYTRGSARLTAGVAHITLGETFQWVTNPDIGLTAHLTSRGKNQALYVESLSTTELVVRSADASADGAFDYIVYGLRIGFEGVPVLREKEEEALIPSMSRHRELFERQPELRASTAIERYKRMRELTGNTTELDLSASHELARAIAEFIPVVDAVEPVVEDLKRSSSADASLHRAAASSTGAGQRKIDGTLQRSSPSLELVDNGRRLPGVVVSTLMPVRGTVEAGDVLVIDPETPGAMRVAQSAADPSVVGIVTDVERSTAKGPRGETRADGETNELDILDNAQQAAVAWGGIANCKVDAGYGQIRPGDFLVSSPTPGMAMRGHDPQFGTIVGKALEGLDSGTGMIRVLVMLR